MSSSRKSSNKKSSRKSSKSNLSGGPTTFDMLLDLKNTFIEPLYKETEALKKEINKLKKQNTKLDRHITAIYKDNAAMVTQVDELSFKITSLAEDKEDIKRVLKERCSINWCNELGEL